MDCYKFEVGDKVRVVPTNDEESRVIDNLSIILYAEQSGRKSIGRHIDISYADPNIIATVKGRLKGGFYRLSAYDDKGTEWYFNGYVHESLLELVETEKSIQDDTFLSLLMM